jgi:uncharacterized protein (DUF2141 family)
VWFLIDLAPGTYAVGAYHDENNNSRLDTDSIGYADRRLPVVEWDARGDQPPSVQRRCLCVGDEDAHATLRIKY